MKQIHSLSFLLFLSATISFVSCTDDANKNGLDTGITGQSWIEGRPLEISAVHILQVPFNAAAPWTAYTREKWCNVLMDSGEKGANTLQLVATSEAAASRTSTVTIHVKGYSAVSFEVTQRAGSGEVAGDMQALNAQVDQYLRERYLWNEEYKTLAPDYTQSYQDFFYGALSSMTTNTLDKRPYKGNDGKTHYRIFSYIKKINTIPSTRAFPSIKKELEYSFGITGMGVVSVGGGFFEYCVKGVYPDSPAARAGIKRGTYIREINGNKITETNFLPLSSALLYPEKILSLKITEQIPDGNSAAAAKEYTMTSEAMYKNPVIYQKVIDADLRHKIGYLVYDEFEAGYDDKLFEVFKEFKAQGVNELVLDFRYNGGGHTMSANLIASCIAGEAYKDALFAKYRYNEERMKALGGKKGEEKFMYSNYQNLNTSLAAGDLGLKRVYCLVGNGTASSSELVINSLRGVDINVVLIGKKTTGKNVGMEPKDIIFGGDSYEVVPITFQSYNAKDFGDYEGGFSPEIPLDEEDANNDTYFDGYIDYGDRKEPLLSRAIQEITGQTPPSTARSAMTRAAGSKILEIPAVFRPGHGGMIKIE